MIGEKKYNSSNYENINLFYILRCPYCLHELEQKNDEAICKKCNENYSNDENGKLDLRLKKSKKPVLDFELGTCFDQNHGNVFQLIKNINPDFTKNYKKIIPERLTEELISHFPIPKDKEITVLDVGCGDNIHRQICENLGYKYIGTDVISSPEISFLSDAHALPIKDNYFDIILAINVFEHLQYPFVAIKEISRILKPKGSFIGVVSFLEPYHMESYYHFTKLGIYSLLNYGNFDIKIISPSPNWDVFKALSTMGFIPMAPKFLIKLLLLPISIFYHLWWNLGILFDTSNSKRLLNKYFTKAGSFVFITKKRDESQCNQK